MVVDSSSVVNDLVTALVLIIFNGDHLNSFFRILRMLNTIPFPYVSPLFRNCTRTSYNSTERQSVVAYWRLLPFRRRQLAPKQLRHLTPARLVRKISI